MRNPDDDNVKSRPGLSGTASAFQSGFDMAGKKKAPRAKKGSAPAPTTTTSPLLPGTNIPVLKRGGHVKRTGLHWLHKNEYVVPAKHRSTQKASHKRTITKR
jgi:hypothetical protein